MSTTTAIDPAKRPRGRSGTAFCGMVTITTSRALAICSTVGAVASVSAAGAASDSRPREFGDPDLPQASFTATVLRTRATYTITPRMFVSGIVQSNSTTNSMGSNLRLRWEYLPGSELFVVYTDDYDTESGPQSTALRNRAFCC